MFIAPDWFQGTLILIGIYLMVFLIILIVGGLLIKFFIKTDRKIIGYIGVVLIAIIVTFSAGSYIWFVSYELPSVQEKTVTIAEWQPVAGIEPNDEGNIVIRNADQLMLVTSEGEGFINKEHFWFQKWETRDLLNKLKINGTYKIKYYGWREGFNSGFPNILNIEQIIDETNATHTSYEDYFGIKLSTN